MYLRYNHEYNCVTFDLGMKRIFYVVWVVGQVEELFGAGLDDLIQRVFHRFQVGQLLLGALLALR